MLSHPSCVDVILSLRPAETQSEQIDDWILRSGCQSSRLFAGSQRLSLRRIRYSEATHEKRILRSFLPQDDTREASRLLELHPLEVETMSEDNLRLPHVSDARRLS